MPNKPLQRLASSFRWQPPEETLALARSLMPTLGISRVTDITRMDRLGVPVYASVRPRGRTLRVHAGKGILPLEAQVGALMEAIEYAAAEPQLSRPKTRLLTVADLVRQFEGKLTWIDFAPKLDARPTPNDTVETIPCHDLYRQEKFAIPAELVFVPYERDGAKAFFGWTTNGLASGNSLDEATIHGLLEVMERDALSMNKARDRSESVDPRDLPAHFAALAAQWQELGVRLAVRYVPNEFGLPCFEARLHEAHDMTVNLAGGSGMHVCRDIALTRAICEAAQSRLSHIHGGRDDITKFYSKFVKWDSSVLGQIEERVVKDMFDTNRCAKYCDVPNYHYNGGSARSILRDLLERLSQCGFQTVLRYEFAVDLGCLHVVKVIVPKCELYEPHKPRIGPRLLARVIGNA